MSTATRAWAVAGGQVYHHSETCPRTDPYPTFESFATDAGLRPCGKCVGTDAEPRADAHDTTPHGDVWCGHCGAGPFESLVALSGHTTGAGHDGDPIACETEPSEADLDSETSDDDPEDATEQAVESAVDRVDDLRTVHLEPLRYPLPDSTDASDSDSEPMYPKECSCGTVCDGSLEWAVHRITAHDARRSELNNLTAEEFEDLVDRADGVSDLADELGWSTTRVLRTLAVFGFSDRVGHPDADGTLHSDSGFEQFEGGLQT